MIPADTRVVYGAQGETMLAVQVDMKRPPRMIPTTHWLACYVMLSRATSIQGLLILRPATFEELSCPPPQYLVDEIGRLLNLERSGTAALWTYLQSLPFKLPSSIRSLFMPGVEERETQRIAAARAAHRQTYVIILALPVQTGPNSGARMASARGPGRPSSV